MYILNLPIETTDPPMYIFNLTIETTDHPT